MKREEEQKAYTKAAGKKNITVEKSIKLQI
jgi:hypothetical protein